MYSLKKTNSLSYCTVENFKYFIYFDKMNMLTIIAHFRPFFITCKFLTCYLKNSNCFYNFYIVLNLHV